MRPEEVRELVEKVVAASLSEGLAVSTIDKKRRILCVILGGISALTPGNVEKWLKDRRNPRTGLPLGPGGRNAYTGEIKWMINHTIFVTPDTGWHEVLKKVRAVPCGTKISEEHFETVVQFAPSLLYELAYRLIFECGFRPHELGSVRACDVIEESDGMVLIDLPRENPSVPSGRNKTGGRPVPVVDNRDMLLEHAENIRRTAGDHALLFPWRPGVLGATFCRMKKKCRENVRLKDDVNGRPVYFNFPGRLYDLRHSAATRMASKGVPDQVLRRVLGWQPGSKMFDVYIHLDRSDVIRTFMNMENASGFGQRTDTVSDSRPG